MLDVTTYVWNLKNKTHKYDRIRLNRQREQTSGYQWGEGMEMDKIGRELGKELREASCYI